MKELYSICRSHPKIWKEYPGGAHNDTIIEEGYFRDIVEFIQEHVTEPH
jgi:abhydrolase domain-containing protein 13